MARILLPLQKLQYKVDEPPVGFVTSQTEGGLIERSIDRS